jgi:ubiquinol-cytochrome c reductase cytochrome b subunit
MVAFQILTGLLCSIYYRPSELTAFSDIIFIVNDVSAGYMVKYLHLNGATMIFVLLYAHLFRAVYYRSYSMLPKV